MSSARLLYLVQRYMEQACSEDEAMELAVLIEGVPDEKLKERLEAIWDRYNATNDLPQDESGAMLDYILSYNRKEMRPKSGGKRWWIWAAAACLVAVLAGYWVVRTGGWENAPSLAAAKGSMENDISPGGNRAVLTLGNGAMVILDSARNGKLARQGNINVIKTGSGLLSYVKQGVTGNTRKTTGYNTLTTPKGGQYQLMLSDGTKVWLNADSRLIFPAVFTGHTRQVTLEGEAYFDVAKDAGRPFKVKLFSSRAGERRGEVEVLGTEFNVEAYPEDQYVTTTLVQGKVAVNSKDQRLVLQPGKQAEIGPGGMLRLNDHADVEQAVAWKNGYFCFNRTDIHTIMRELARWYDIKVEYADNIPEHHFGAIISKYNNISRILKMLEATGYVHFSIEGKKVNVLP